MIATPKIEFTDNPNEFCSPQKKQKPEFKNKTVDPLQLLLFMIGACSDRVSLFQFNQYGKVLVNK